MKSIWSPNKTSARLLVDFAAKNWNIENDDVTDDNLYRFLMVSDLYIKARSYAIINKLSFLVALLMGVAVLVWPSIAFILTKLPFGFTGEVFQSAVIQTTVTSFAGLAFAIYNNYKKRQMYMENLMRYVIFSNDPIAALMDKILKEMERIDNGFVFSESTEKKPKDDKPD